MKFSQLNAVNLARDVDLKVKDHSSSKKNLTTYTFDALGNILVSDSSHLCLNFQCGLLLHSVFSRYYGV